MKDRDYIIDKRIAIQMESLLLDIVSEASLIDLHKNGAFHCIVSPATINRVRAFFKMPRFGIGT